MSYNIWNVKQLKEELRRRGAVIYGKKSELVERLMAYDRNNNFGNIIDQENDPTKMKLPVKEKYCDLHGGKRLEIQVTRTHIEAYMEHFDQKITAKAEQLFNSKFIQYIKYSCTEMGIYFNSAIKAAMKKLIYVVDIFITFENNIEQCQCECAAGEGPAAHCKHVLALLLALELFLRTQNLQIAATCTDKLQTFHQPKVKFNSSPVKAQKLPFRNIPLNNFEPRRLEQRNVNWYQDYFRNLCINFQDSSMPILQLFEPASPYGIENDHSYCKETFVNQVFESMGLQNLTMGKIHEIEVKTRGQRNNKLWHYERSFRITSTSFKDICCVTERRNKKLLTRSILNKKPIKTKATQHGNIYEDEAKRHYEHLKGITIQECGLFVVDGYPFLAASPDGLVNDNLIIEIKCPYSARHSKITTESVPYLEIKENFLYLKETHAYYYQIMGQLLATNRNDCDLIIYTFCDFVVVRIVKNEDFIARMLINLQSFYDAYFLTALKEKYYYKGYK